jgi:pyruvate-ferredoxin/flavodoxin oxidoreductase
MEVAMTFADFAITEARFRKHFRKVPRDAWNENMIALVDFLELPDDERKGKFPYIWVVDKKQHLARVLVAKTIVESCEERRDFWIMLRSLTDYKPEEEEPENVEEKIRAEIVGNISRGLMKMAGGSGDEPTIDISQLANGAGSEAAEIPVEPGSNGYMAPWLETEECTSCDECTQLNSKIFAYNTDKKAYILDPLGGPYEDIVKAAEKCTARVIHPGLPKDRTAKDIEKWIKRGEKFN